MTQKVRALVILTVLAEAIFAFDSPARAADLSMKQNMEILSEPSPDPALGTLPSIQIDTIQATVPVNDRMDADEAFDRPFTESLKEGMAWYLGERGLKLAGTGADLRLTGIIESYEGWKGWGHWGVDLKLRVKLFRGSEMVLSEVLQSFLKYSDDEAVEDQEASRYKAHQASARFAPILFARIGMDLSEKLITLLKEKSGGLDSPAPVKAPGQAQPTATASRGSLTVEATVPNAEVLVDGKLVGTTPVENLALAAGPHSIEVRKAGYRPWKREVTVLEDAAGRVRAEMEAEKDR